MYFNTDSLPAVDTYRKHGYRKEYGADGHVVAAISPDSDKNTMNNSNHYTIIKKTYYADGKFRTEKFYYKDNNAAQPRNGQYGHLYISGKPICIYKNGNKYS